MSLLAAAEALARRAHQGQMRDDSDQPYIVHPARVATRLARRFPGDAALVAAGWCHDVIEDCPHIAIDELRAAIGDDALAIVREVTNPSKQHPQLPRAERKAMDRAHLATISMRARCLKLADRADNLRDGCASPDRDWLATYVRESRLFAEVLRGSDPELEADLAAALDAAARAAGIG
ncbi:MAG: HD domain-containing protein [Planctomycetes bacterium]|nr:HD domain-containing protein [Planctomycetota bacterium]